MDTNFVDLLKKRQLRLTKTRLLLLGQLAKAPAPLSADQLWEIIGKDVLDRVTVYRELRSLKEHSIIQEVRLGARAKLYELPSDDHAHHLVCLSCGAVDKVSMPHDLDAEEQEITRTKKFQVVRHALEFFGYCAKCRV